MCSHILYLGVIGAAELRPGTPPSCCSINVHSAWDPSAGLLATLMLSLCVVGLVVGSVCRQFGWQDRYKKKPSMLLAFSSPSSELHVALSRLHELEELPRLHLIFVCPFRLSPGWCLFPRQTSLSIFKSPREGVDERHVHILSINLLAFPVTLII